ncbi:MAG: hypothetical protein ABSF29_09850 [Tepidisphaeraceae bacterium]|jgi:hypothetical protein
MNLKGSFLALVGISACVSFLTASSRAATVITDIGGSGWTATFSDLALDADPSQPAGQLDVEKAAAFTSSSLGEGLLITFTQTSASAKPVIDFTDESVTNVTGTTWTGFDFVLLNTGNSSASFESTSDSPFAAPSGIFTTVNVTSVDGNPTVEYGGGSQANLATALYGIGADGDLLIDADPLGIGTTFTFKEVPVNDATPVPLPAALWQGLGGLIALAIIAAVKKNKSPAA